MTPPKGPSVYLLRCADGSLYCGWAMDVERRVRQHAAGRGARYTRARLPVELVYEESCTDVPSALHREAEIKRHSRRQKLALIAGGPHGG